jgi:hypothetical protein
MQHTLTGTQFPDGTVVAAFPAERASGEGSSSVVAGGSVTFRNLYEGEQYVVRGYVAGRPLEERFESGYLDASPQVSIGDAVVAGQGVQLSTDGLGRLVISSTPAVRGAPVALGNMGAGSSLSMSNSAPVAVTGTLNANHVMTISDLRVGEPMFLVVTQDAVGAHSFAIRVNGVTTPWTVGSGASAATVLLFLATSGSSYQVVPLSSTGVSTPTVQQTVSFKDEGFAVATLAAPLTFKDEGSTLTTLSVPFAVQDEGSAIGSLGNVGGGN